jgi:hypothetical protein
MLINVSGMFAITWFDAVNRAGGEAKLPGQRGMKEQHVPDIDRRRCAVPGASLGVGGAGPGVANGVFAAVVGVTVRAARRSAVRLSHESSLSRDGPATKPNFATTNVRLVPAPMLAGP